MCAKTMMGGIGCGLNFYKFVSLDFCPGIFFQIQLDLEEVTIALEEDNRGAKESNISRKFHVDLFSRQFR